MFRAGAVTVLVAGTAILFWLVSAETVEGGAIVVVVVVVSSDSSSLLPQPAINRVENKTVQKRKYLITGILIITGY